MTQGHDHPYTAICQAQGRACWWLGTCDASGSWLPVSNQSLLATPKVDPHDVQITCRVRPRPTFVNVFVEQGIMGRPLNAYTHTSSASFEKHDMQGLSIDSGLWLSCESHPRAALAHNPYRPWCLLTITANSPFLILPSPPFSRYIQT